MLSTSNSVVVVLHSSSSQKGVEIASNITSSIDISSGLEFTIDSNTTALFIKLDTSEGSKGWIWSNSSSHNDVISLEHRAIIQGHFDFALRLLDHRLDKSAWLNVHTEFLADCFSDVIRKVLWDNHSKQTILWKHLSHMHSSLFALLGQGTGKLASQETSSNNNYLLHVVGGFVKCTEVSKGSESGDVLFSRLVNTRNQSRLASRCDQQFVKVNNRLFAVLFNQHTLDSNIHIDNFGTLKKGGSSIRIC
mmetsp:Transcript_18901/g.26424  ORF Transcript_18901/g.26424 Transcript_18901/m.26424 type:complete len:249 (+) Transcript_18901:386-1132(+)